MGLEAGKIVICSSEAKKGDAFYVDFTFDSRTNIDGKGTIQFEE